MFLFIALASATAPTWVNPNSITHVVDTCFGGDMVAFQTWTATPTDINNADSPSNMAALDYCRDWADTMGNVAQPNPVINPMNQISTVCAVYHCLEHFFGLSSGDIQGVGCVMSMALVDFNAMTWDFPSSYGGSDTTDYSPSQCTCNAALLLAAPSPVDPDWLTMTGTTALCVSKVQWDPSNAPFFGCALRACMPNSPMKDYAICLQDNYYGFEGLDQCDKLDKLVIGNLAMPVPLAIVGIVFFFIAILTYAIAAACCNKRSKSSNIGV